MPSRRLAFVFSAASKAQLSLAEENTNAGSAATGHFFVSGSPWQTKRDGRSAAKANPAKKVLSSFFISMTSAGKNSPIFIRTIFEQLKRGKISPLFQNLQTTDFYDGPIEGFCNITGHDGSFFFKLIWADFENGQRIFSLIKVPENWLLQNNDALKTYLNEGHRYDPHLIQQMDDLYTEYKGERLLIRGREIVSPDYELAIFPGGKLVYFREIESMVEENLKTGDYWKSFFI